MSSESFRKILINTMIESGQLKGSTLGNGYIDWHNKNEECGVTFTLSNGESFSMIITKE